MLAQKTGGSIVTITAALARNPIRGVPAAVPMITKGGLETITQHLAMEYAREGIRVERGRARRPLHADAPEYAQRFYGKPVADGSAVNGPGDHGCRPVFD